MTVRHLVALVVLTLAPLALAGCVSNNNTTAPFAPPIDPDRDGDPDQSPGAGNDGTDDQGDPSPGDGGAPPGSGTDTSDDDVTYRAEGNVHLIVDVPPSVTPGTPATWHITVEHRGDPDDDPFPYSSICHDPLRVTLHGDNGEEFPIHEPMAECLAYGTAHLEPGDSIEREWDWNVTYWTGNGYRSLHAGSYDLEFRFERQDEQDGRGGGPAGTHRITLR